MYGKQTAVTAQQAYESSRRNGGAGSVLTQEQFTKAFNTGRSSKDARIQNSAARQRGEGKVYFGQDVDYGGERYKAASEDMVSSAELGVIKTLAKITGTDVVFYQSEADMSGRYKGANGFMRNGTMYLDVNAGANRTSEESAVLLTAAHELTHYIRENNAEGYAQLRDFVTRHLIEDGVDIEALAEQKAARENGLLSMDEAVEEVIADSCEMMLEDTRLPEIMAKENPGLYEQIREWIANFAEKLRKAFTGVEARHAEAKAMMKYADELSRIWDSALAGAVRNAEAATENRTAAPNNRTNDGLFAETAKFSNRQREEDTIKRQIKDNLEELNDMEPVASIYDSLDMGKDKGQYRKWIVDKLASTGYQVDRKGFGKITFTPKQLNAGINYVNDPAEMAAFLTIPKVLKQGAEIREHDNHKERNVETITFSAPVEINGTRGNVAVVVKLTKNYFKALRILTPEGKVYSLSGYEKTELTPTQHTPTSGAESASISSVNNTIPQSNTESNTKFSMRERDDAADVKTAEKYFGTTYKIAEAGYLLRDGKLLDMSGRHEGAPGGYRTVDHRDITDAFDGDYGDGSYSGGMVQFMQAGNIRLSPESGGINLSTKPNAKQLDVLDRYISSFRGEVTLDIDNANGDTVVSIEYPKRTYSKRIINDINEYFDNGIIPAQPSDLGQFRYSMRDVAEDDTADERRGRQESYAELRRQNEELRRRTEYWKGQTRTTKEATVRKADTDALARRLTEELHNTDAADTVKEELKRMGDYIVQTDGQELSYAELKDWAAAIADHILSGSEAEIESGMEDARRELLDYLKSNKLKINEREMLDLPEGWKREHRRIRFGKDGLPIDTAWMELQEKFGEGAFPSDITSQSDMLFHIADMERAWQPVRGNPFENYMGEMRETVAQDILDTMLSDEIRQTAKTAADRARDRMNKAVAEERTRYNDMKSRMQERIQQVYQEGVARKQEAVAKEKAAFGFWVRNQRKMKKLCAFNEARAESFLQTYSSNTTVGEPINSRRNSISQPGTESNAGFSMFAHQNRVFFVFSRHKPTSNKTRRPPGLRVISSYSSHFHVIALITRLTDREALAGKYAVFAHIIKQLVTAYAAVYEAYSVVLLCKLPHGVLTVYVIHSYSGMRCNIPIYKALQHLCFKSVNEKAAASRSAHIIHFSAAASRKLRFQSAQQIIDIRIKEHTVYRLKVHALVMYVYKLSQSILCFRGAYERCRSLCRGERMVAVSHGKKHPLPLFPAFLRKRRESGEYAPLLILGNEPAAKVPAAEHKVKIIELRELRRVYAFYYLPALIVHEDHDMRQFQRSIPADIDARRYAREHRPLRGADEAFCPGLIAVILQRKCADDAAASPF